VPPLDERGHQDILEELRHLGAQMVEIMFTARRGVGVLGILSDVLR